jgi:hypothetical protein
MLPIIPRTLFRLVTLRQLGGSLIAFAFGAVCSLAQTSDITRLPGVTVPGGDLGEAERVGANQQPEWTTERRFATTRVYVIEPGQVQFEQWWKAKYLRGGGQDHLSQSEVEFGFNPRLQLDLYENMEKPDGQGWQHKGNQVEMRYAFAEWGKIPLNPTIYGEWKINKREPDAFELKLLLGQELSQRCHWGMNVAYEQETGGGRESEFAFSQAVSYMIRDKVLSVGLEMNIERASGPNLHGRPGVEVLLGPSVQWRPSPRLHLDLVPLIGLTNDSPRVETYLIFGYDFGKKSGEHFAPASNRSR